MSNFLRVITIFLLNAFFIFLFSLIISLAVIILSSGNPTDGGLLIGVSPLLMVMFVWAVIAIIGGTLNGTALNVLYPSLTAERRLPFKTILVLSSLTAVVLAIAALLGGSQYDSAYFLTVATTFFFVVFVSANLVTIAISKRMFPGKDLSDLV